MASALSSLRAFFKKHSTVAFIQEQIWELLAALILQLCACVPFCEAMRTCYRRRRTPSLTHLALFLEAIKYKRHAK